VTSFLRKELSNDEFLPSRRVDDDSRRYGPSQVLYVHISTVELATECRSSIRIHSRLGSVAIVLENVISFDNALLNDEEFNARKA
jgi:hypothetical protein